MEMKIPKPNEIPIGQTVYIGRLKIRGTKPKEPVKPSGSGSGSGSEDTSNKKSGKGKQ